MASFYDKPNLNLFVNLSGLFTRSNTKLTDLTPKRQDVYNIERVMSYE